MSVCAKSRGIRGLKMTFMAGAVAFSALLGTTTPSYAGIAPDMFMSVQLRDTSHVPLFTSGEVNLQSSGFGNVSDGWVYFNPQGTYPALNDSRYSSSGLVNGVTESGVNPARLLISMVFSNLTTDTMEYIIDYRMPLTASYNSPMPWTANLAGTLNGNDATLFTIEGMSMFQAYIDGNLVGTQYDDPSGTFVGGGTDDFSTAPIGGIAPSATQDLRIRLAFTLTPGDQATFNGNLTLTIVPAPGVAALLGLAGLVTPRRRRRR